MSNHSQKHPNDLQPKGHRLTPLEKQQIAEAKKARKFYAEKITRRELAQFEQSYRRIIEALVNFNNWVVENVPGLKEKYEAEAAKHKAEAAKAHEGQAPVATPAATPEAA